MTTSVTFRRDYTVGATSYTAGQSADLADDVARGLLASSIVNYKQRVIPPSAPASPLAASSTSTNVLTLGVKGDVLTITDAAITAGQATLSRTGATKFTNADVGKYVQVVGAGAVWNDRGAWAPATTYAFGDKVTFGGNTYVAGATIGALTVFSTAGWTTVPSNTARTLMATITSVSSGVATLSATAGTTVSGATCVYGTDDTAALTTAMATGADLYFPGNRAYFLADAFVPSDVTLRFAPGVVIKVPRYTTTDVAPLRLLTSNRSLSTYVSRVNTYGVPRIDMSELTPPSGTVPRGVHLLNVQNFHCDGFIGVGLPGTTGNVVQTGQNSGGAYTRRGRIGQVTSVATRGLGSSAVQHTGGRDIEYGVLFADGGVPFRIEMDNNTGVVTDNITCQVAATDGASLFPNSAVYFSAHDNTCRNVTVHRIRAEGGADGVSSGYTTVGSVSNCKVEGGRVTGGGRAHNIQANDMKFLGLTLANIRVDGALLVPPGNRQLPGSLVGVGFAYTSGMSLRDCIATNCQAEGYLDVFSTGSAIVPGTATFTNCRADNNTSYGLRNRFVSLVQVLGGRYGSDPVVPIVAQLLTAGEVAATSGWNAAVNAAAPSGSGGTLTMTAAASTGTQVTNRTATGASAHAITGGHFYKFTATVVAGTAPAGARCAATFWFYKADGSATATGSVAPGSSAIATPGTVAYSIQAPPDAAFMAVIVQGFSNIVGGTITAGWTWLFSNMALQEVPALQTQAYGLEADAGATIKAVAADLTGNSGGRSTGPGTVTEV